MKHMGNLLNKNTHSHSLSIEDWKKKSKNWKVILLVQNTQDKPHTLLYVACECSLSQPKKVDFSTFIGK